MIKRLNAVHHWVTGLKRSEPADEVQLTDCYIFIIAFLDIITMTHDNLHNNIVSTPLQLAIRNHIKNYRKKMLKCRMIAELFTPYKETLFYFMNCFP